jgi:hypothetical protein
MNMTELLKDNPKAAIVVKQWLLDKLLEGLNDDKLPEDFKEYARQEGITDDKVVGILEGAPRAMFDVFDSHGLYVETIVDTGGIFWWKIGETQSTIGYEFRINCDGAAIVEAFKLLEEKI